MLIVWGFARAPVVQVWSPPYWTRYVAMVLMLPVFILLIAAYLPGKIKETVKHPFLVAIKTWALAHLIANGDLASIILFGSFLAYAVIDRIALKHRPATGLVTVAETGPCAQRPHRRRRGACALRGLPRLAAPAADWIVALGLSQEPARRPRMPPTFLQCKNAYISAIRSKSPWLPLLGASKWQTNLRLSG